MHDRALLVSAASLGVASALTGATPLVPHFETWPPIEPAPVVAVGFQTTEWTEYQWHNDTWEPTSRQKRRYDDHARIASVQNEGWFMDRWPVAQAETMTYDDAGRLIEIVRQEAVGIALQNRGRSEYDRSATNSIREPVSAWSHEERWGPLSQEVFLYDDAGRLVVHTSSRLQGNRVGGVSQVLQRYDPAGRRTEALKQRDQGRRWVATERVAFAFDDRDRLMRVALFVADKGDPQWTEGLRITHDHDEADRCTVTSRHTRGSPDGLEISSRLVREYDEHGNEVERRTQARRDGAWVDGRKERFSHRKQP